MFFILMNAPTTFRRVAMKIFVEYLDKFTKVFIDNFSIYIINDEYLGHIVLCLQKC